MAMHCETGHYYEEPEREGVFWSVICDGCGQDQNGGGEFDSWDDPSYAREVAEVFGNAHVDLCYDCWRVLTVGYSEGEMLALEEPATAPQGYMAAMAALGFLRQHQAAPASPTTGTEARDAL